MVRPPKCEVPFFAPPGVDDPLNPTNPLFLHPSDNPGAILVADLLNGENYISWSQSMRTALLAKNKLGFIDGSLKRPVDPHNLTLAIWERCNGMVVSWLQNSTVLAIKSSLMYLDSAAQI